MTKPQERDLAEAEEMFKKAEEFLNPVIIKLIAQALAKTRQEQHDADVGAMKKSYRSPKVLIVNDEQYSLGREQAFRSIFQSLKSTNPSKE